MSPPDAPPARQQANGSRRGQTKEKVDSAMALTQRQGARRHSSPLPASPTASSRFRPSSASRTTMRALRRTQLRSPRLRPSQNQNLSLSVLLFLFREATADPRTRGRSGSWRRNRRRGMWRRSPPMRPGRPARARPEACSGGGRRDIPRASSLSWERRPRLS